MFNETIFLLHLIIVIIFTLGALRLGREALMTWVAVQGMLANLFVLKQIQLFNLDVTCSDVYAVGAFLSLNLLQEFFDRSFAKKAILVTAMCQAFFAVMSQFQLLYIPNAADYTHDAFSLLLTPYPRILFASLAVFYVVQSLDVLIFQALKKVLPNSGFALRNGIGLTVSQTLDTVLFSIFGLWGLVGSLFDVMVMSLAIKLILVALATPFTLFVNRFKSPVRSS